METEVYIIHGNDTRFEGKIQLPAKPGEAGRQFVIFEGGDFHAVIREVVGVQPDGQTLTLAVPPELVNDPKVPGGHFPGIKNGGCSLSIYISRNQVARLVATVTERDAVAPGQPLGPFLDKEYLLPITSSLV